MSLTQREAFARTMEHLCTHDSHGYTQGNRWGNGSKETVDLGDGVSVELMQGDRDCSSAIISALNAVGIDTGDATYTGNMKRNILNTGLFEWKGEEFIAGRGDIYLNEACHTAMSVDDESTRLAEFAISENGTIYGAEGDQTGNESRVVNYYNYPWDGILHWTSDGATLGASATNDTGQNEATDIDTLARAVIAGTYGNGAERKEKLGANYDAVQARVNELLNGTSGQKGTDDVDTLARDVIKGNYGNGSERRSRLGALYDAVQARVNELLHSK